MRKLPSMSAAAPLVVPSINTVAPGRASPGLGVFNGSFDGARLGQQAEGKKREK
jgi:hypothetical protein